MGFIFIVLECLLPSHYNSFFVFGHGVSFLGGLQSPPVDGFQQLVVISVLSQDEMSACPSILLF